MATPTNTTYLARISQFLWGVTIAQERAFKGGSINAGRDLVLYMERKALEYGVAQSLSGLTGVSNYVYSLIGGKVNLANQILINSSGGVLVNPTTGDSSTLIAFNLEFTVGSGGMIDGQTTYTINYPYIMQDSITVELPQSNLPVGDPNQLSYTVAYTNTEATITFLNGTPNIGVQNGMLFIIRGLRFISAISSGSSTTVPIPATTWYTVPTAGNTITVPTIVNKLVQSIFRGGFASGEVVFAGTPISNQTLSVQAAGTLTVNSGNAWLAGEQVMIQYLTT